MIISYLKLFKLHYYLFKFIIILESKRMSAEKKNVTLSLKKSTIIELKRVAENEKRSMSSQIEFVFEEWLEEIYNKKNRGNNV